MSNENAPTGRAGVSTSYGTAVFDGRPTGEELDALFEVLADEQRRRILAYLDGRDDDVVAFSDLIRAVADGSGDEEGAPPVGRERVAMRLHHAHLPKLADAGLVEFDARSETVRYRGGPVASDWIELSRTHESGSGRP